MRTSPLGCRLLAVGVPFAAAGVLAFSFGLWTESYPLLLFGWAAFLFWSALSAVGGGLWFLGALERAAEDPSPRPPPPEGEGEEDPSR
ncbi:MAG: hypothetical protein K2X82_08830 [Gemmataceae bacterium]|nr:hypothetical protein [Gemmataceae bacterium]